MDRKSAFACFPYRTRRLNYIFWVATFIWGTAIFCNFPMGENVSTFQPPTLTPLITPNSISSDTPTVPTTDQPTSNPGLFRFPDGANDGLNCQNGLSASGLLTPEVDIRSGWVIKENDAYVFHVEFSEVDDLESLVKLDTVDFIGGIELYDLAGLQPEKDENWYFNQTGNLSFNFAWNKEFDELLAWRAEYQESGWVVDQGVYYPISIERNVLQITVPLVLVPDNSKWMVVASNYASCDVLGMKEGFPGLPLP